MSMKALLVIILAPAAFASLVLAGCENQPGGTGIGKNAREAVEQAGDYLEKKRKEFLRETDEKLRAMEAELEEMRERMEAAGDEARAGVRERIEARGHEGLDGRGVGGHEGGGGRFRG
jgi:outer membrane murein-binding lipoprotein Lpp